MFAAILRLGLLGLLPFVPRNKKRWTRYAATVVLFIAIAGRITACASRPYLLLPPQGSQSVKINAAGLDKSQPIPLIVNITN